MRATALAGASAIVILVSTPFGWPEPVPGRAALTVTSTFPRSQSLAAAPNTELRVRLDREVDPASLNEGSMMVFGRWSGVATGVVRVGRNPSEVIFTPDRPFHAGEMVMATLARTTRDASGNPLPTAYTWTFWIAAGPGSLDQPKVKQLSTRREGEGLVQSYGAYAGDLDGDGFSDLAVPNEVANDVRIFFNDGAGSYDEFTVLEIPNGAVPSPNEGGDFNGDGIVDFAVGNAGNSWVTVFLGRGDGTFHPGANTAADRGVRGVCVLDLDGDGDVDIATANMQGERRRGTVSILLNDGRGGFTRGANHTGGRARGEKTCAVADVNEDGILDLLVGAYSSEDLLVYLGDGHGNLELAGTHRIGGNVWMIVTGDLNGDGHADVAAANRRQHSLTVLYGDGQGGMGDPVAYDVGEQPLAVDVGDVDGDGDLDVITSNISSKDFTLLENDGTGRLGNPRTLGASAAGSCAIIHDRDGDGDLDITGVDEVDDMVFLWTNPGR